MTIDYSQKIKNITKKFNNKKKGHSKLSSKNRGTFKKMVNKPKKGHFCTNYKKKQDKYGIYLYKQDNKHPVYNLWAQRVAMLINGDNLVLNGPYIMSSYSIMF